jgi:chromosome segregation ATPase
VTQALEPVKATELGKLVAKRETLASQIKAIRGSLAEITRYESPERNVRYLAEAQKSRKAAEKALTELQADLLDAESFKSAATTTRSQRIVAELLERINAAIDHAKQTITYQDEYIVRYSTTDDRVIVLTNSLAELELALAQVKREIKEASK